MIRWLTPAFLLVPLGAQCVTWSPFAATGNVPVGLQPPGTLTEISGVVASRHHAGVLWVHDDSGNAPGLIALRADGSLAQQYVVAGVANRDWEDLARGPGPELGHDYLYLGEIGNNSGQPASFAMIRVAEPDVPPQPTAVRTLAAAETFRFRYPSGAPDAETLLIDPVDGTPYIVTKRLGVTAEVYRYPMPLDTSVEKVLVLAVTFPYLPPVFTGGDIAQDGSVIYLRDYTRAIAFVRPRGTAFAAAFAGSFCSIQTGLQGQAEAIAVEPDGLGLILISEGAGAPVMRARGTRAAGFAGWWCFGTGVAGARGVPGLGCDRAPVLGAVPLTLGVFRAAPGATGAWIVATTALPAGLPFAGGWLYVLPGVVVPLTVDAAGTARLGAFPLPDQSVLRGIELHAQVMTADPAAATGIGLSAGLTMHLER